MLDLVLWSPDKPTLAAFAVNRGLFRDGNPVPGVRYFWWKDSGKFMIEKGTYAGDIQVTPPRYLSGLVLILRLHNDFFQNDKLDDDRAKAQHMRSRVVKYIRNNGIPGTTIGGWPYYELDGVRIFRPSDVEAFLDSKGLPGHIWVGGNSY